MDMKQIFEVVKKRKIQAAVITCGILMVITFGFLFGSVERQGKKQQALSMEEQAQLVDMTAYLDEIDSVVVENQKRLAEATLFQSDTQQVLETFQENLSVLEKDLMEIETIIHKNTATESTTNRENFSVIEQDLTKLEEVVNQRVETMSTTNEESFSIIENNLTKLEEILNRHAGTLSEDNKESLSVLKSDLTILKEVLNTLVLKDDTQKKKSQNCIADGKKQLNVQCLGRNK